MKLIFQVDQLMLEICDEDALAEYVYWDEDNNRWEGDEAPFYRFGHMIAAAMNRMGIKPGGRSKGRNDV